MPAKRAALLMKELAGGEIASEITDICSAPIEKFKVELDIKRVNRLIGKEIPADTIRTILGALDIKIEAEEGDLWRVAVPPYRVDVTREADLVEEILRIYGYNNIPVPSHVNSALSYAPKPDRNKLMNLAADYLSANGFTEIMSNSLTKAAYYEGLTSYKPEHCVKILNPLSNDLNVMRQTLLFNMLEAVQLNANHRNGDAGVVPRVLDPAERIGVAVYGAVIAGMLYSVLRYRGAYAAWFRFAALLFVFSDGVIAWSRFIGAVPGRTYVVMVPYYLAQCLFFCFAVKSLPALPSEGRSV